MEEHDLEYILTPALESDRLARELAQETDADILTISPVAGQTDEWMDKDWGYLEQMLNVNLVSLKTALEAQ
jgi:zinc transport system substrate-binding protein